MLDQIINIGKNMLGDKLKGEFNLNENQVDESMVLAKESVHEGLKKEALGGNLGQIMSLFNGQSSATSSNPIVSSIINIFAGKLGSKMGLSSAISSQLANMAIPFIMSKFADKETGTAENEAGLMSMLGMDKDNDIAGLLKGGLGNAAGNLLGGLFS